MDKTEAPARTATPARAYCASYLAGILTTVGTMVAVQHINPAGADRVAEYVVEVDRPAACAAIEAPLPAADAPAQAAVPAGAIDLDLAGTPTRIPGQPAPAQPATPAGTPHPNLAAIPGPGPLYAPLAYPCTFNRAVDGDTFVLTIRLWRENIRDNLILQTTRKIRLFGVDTPEKRPRKGTPTEKTAEKIRAQQAQDLAEASLRGGASLTFVYASKTDNFGRPLGTILISDKQGNQTDIRTILLDSKLAKIYKK